MARISTAPTPSAFNKCVWIKSCFSRRISFCNFQIADGASPRKIPASSTAVTGSSIIRIAARDGPTARIPIINAMPGTAATGFSIFNGSAGTTPLIIDVSGYFE